MAGVVSALLLTELDERVPRNYFRNRSCAFNLPDSEFMKLFRLNIESVLELSGKLDVHLKSSRLPVYLRASFWTT